MLIETAEAFSFGVVPSLLLIIGIAAALFFMLRAFAIGMTEPPARGSLSSGSGSSRIAEKDRA